MTARIAVVLGTRPEIIKLAGVIRRLGSRGYVIHSGQHYDSGLTGVFFNGFALPHPELRLTGVGGMTRGDQFSLIIAQLTAEFTRSRPAAVVVQGDTNTAAAAAQAAHFMDIPVVHVEAGLRSFDRSMPDEINRRMISLVADLHCAPTAQSRGNLLADGVPANAIEVTGNTVIESTLEMLPDEATRTSLLLAHAVDANAYVLATVHRPENTDDPERLAHILRALGGLGVPVVVPMHPRTGKQIKRFDLAHLLEPLHVTAPTDHATFLGLAADARLLVSDSGGVQEECTVLKRPLVVIRNTTERPEAIAAGFARRVRPDAGLSSALTAAWNDHQWHAKLAATDSPFGDGEASQYIVRGIDQLLTEPLPPRRKRRTPRRQAAVR